jgi:hypothetical protein
LDGSEGKVRNGCFLRRKGSQNQLAEEGSETSATVDGVDRIRVDTVWENTRTGKLGQGVVAVETVNLGDGFTTIDRMPESSSSIIFASLPPSPSHLHTYFDITFVLTALTFVTA